MGSALSARPERRAATRYRVPARAQLYWSDAQAVPVSIADISAGGCSVVGDRVPSAGARLFLSLDVPGVPNVRLPATTVRAYDEGRKSVAAIRFDLPPNSVRGLDKLLADRCTDRVGQSCVLVVDADPRSRERVASCLRAKGFRVLAVGDAEDAEAHAGASSVDVVLARADGPGLDALTTLTLEAPQALRIAYGRNDATQRALSLGCAQAVADDPTSAKCLSHLLGDRLGRVSDRA